MPGAPAGRPAPGGPVEAGAHGATTRASQRWRSRPTSWSAAASPSLPSARRDRRFQGLGVPVLARGERFTQSQYYLALAADVTPPSPDGFVLLRRPGALRHLLPRDALDKLQSQVRVPRRRVQSPSPSPSPSSAYPTRDREATRRPSDGLWRFMRDDIVASRKLRPRRSTRM